jgi:hypothetical protein
MVLASSEQLNEIGAINKILQTTGCSQSTLIIVSAPADGSLVQHLDIVGTSNSSSDIPIVSD